MRVRGGFRGLLAAFDAGIADELSAADPVDDKRLGKRMRPADVRAAHRKALAKERGR